MSAASLRAWAWRHRLELAAAVGVTLWLGFVGRRTAGDVDEGFYLLAGELVARGRLPYRDFFYPQAPYLPYLLAPLTLFGPTFTAARLFFALLGGATGGLVTALVHRATGRRGPALAAVLLFAVNEVSWQWLPSVRPYGPAALLAVVMAWCLSDRDPPRPAMACLAGLCAGLAAGLRLLLLPLVFAAVAGAWLRGANLPRLRALALLVLVKVVLWAPPGTQLSHARWAVPLGLAVVALGPRACVRARRGLSALAGSLLAAAPAWLAYRAAPEGFWFGNIAFHADRVAAAAPADPAVLGARDVALASLFGLAPLQQVSALGVELTLLALLGLAALALAPSRHVITPGLAIVGLGLAAVVPAPLHEHYVTPMVPLLAGLAGLGLAALAADARNSLQRNVFGIIVVTLTLSLGQASFRQKWRHGVFGLVGEFRIGHFRPGLLDASAAWTRWVSNRHPGPVLALWPGSALGVADRLLRGTENHFARNARLPSGDEDAAERLRVVTRLGLRALVQNRIPAVVTFDREAEHEGGEEFRALLERCGYRRRGGVPAVSDVYARVEDPSPDCLRRGR